MIGSFLLRPPFVCAVFVLMISSSCSTPSSTGPINTPESPTSIIPHLALEPDEICVIHSTDLEAKSVDLFAKAEGYIRKKRRSLEGLGFTMSIFRARSGQPLEQGITAFRQQFPSQVIDANHHYSIQESRSIKNPRRYGHQLVGWNRQAVSCAVDNIRIGVIDTSIDMSHPLLNNQSIHRQSFLPEGTPFPDTQHGTAVATLLTASGSSEGGLLPNAPLFVAEAFQQKMDHRIIATTWTIVRALDWLVSQHVDVINLSLGGPSNALLGFAIHQTLKKGIPLVAAAGNGGPQGKPQYPAAQEGVIAVTALDAGMNSYDNANKGSYISLSAPGVDIWVPSGEKQGAYKSGTSFAAPFVTAAVVALRLIHPHWTPRQIIHHLATRAKDLGTKGKDETFGWGLVQIPQACQNHSLAANTSDPNPR